jgi:phytoene desaturase
MAEKVAIVGAGVGGLATAVRLASKGHEVEVYEKLPRPGGRCNIITDGGFKFDTGPSFVLMPDLFEELFSYLGEDLGGHLNLHVLDPSYKIFYPDGDTCTVFRDPEKTKEELERLEKGASKTYDLLIEETASIYRRARPLLYQCLTLKDLARPSVWALLPRIRAFETYWHLAGRFFKSEKLRHAFTFEAMFLGVSAFDAPGFYSILSYVDHVQKISHPIGGMYEIPAALEKLAQRFGVRLQYGVEVKGIGRRNGKLTLAIPGEEIPADKVVINADYAYAQGALLKRRTRRYSYSCSVYLMYLGLKRKVEGLEHHTLFFARDPKRNIRQVFEESTLPDDPSFYVHVPTKTDPSLAPEGKDLAYVLVPVPNLENRELDIKQEESKLKEIVFGRIEEHTGIRIQDLVEVEHFFYPEDFVGRYNIIHGAPFGLAHTFWQSAFFRPRNYDSKIENLYFVGAGTQPGCGLPAVIASSRIVADLIEQA